MPISAFSIQLSASPRDACRQLVVSQKLVAEN